MNWGVLPGAEKSVAERLSIVDTSTAMTRISTWVEFDRAAAGFAFSDRHGVLGVVLTVGHSRPP